MSNGPEGEAKGSKDASMKSCYQIIHDNSTKKIVGKLIEKELIW